jgi:hypothetical protein
MFISCWFGGKLTAKKLFVPFISISFYMQSTKCYFLLNASGAAALTGRRNVRSLSKTGCRAGMEKFCHRYTMEDIESGEEKLIKWEL